MDGVYCLLMGFVIIVLTGNMLSLTWYFHRSGTWYSKVYTFIRTFLDGIEWTKWSCLSLGTDFDIVTSTAQQLIGPCTYWVNVFACFITHNGSDLARDTELSYWNNQHDPVSIVFNKGVINLVPTMYFVKVCVCCLDIHRACITSV